MEVDFGRPSHQWMSTHGQFRQKVLSFEEVVKLGKISQSLLLTLKNEKAGQAVTPNGLVHTGRPQASTAGFVVNECQLSADKK